MTIKYISWGLWGKGHLLNILMSQTEDSTNYKYYFFNVLPLLQAFLLWRGSSIAESSVTLYFMSLRTHFLSFRRKFPVHSITIWNTIREYLIADKRLVFIFFSMLLQHLQSTDHPFPVYPFLHWEWFFILLTMSMSKIRTWFCSTMYTFSFPLGRAWRISVYAIANALGMFS